MTGRKLVTGGFYKHFKNKMYQVRGVAYHSETKEKMVVYQALYGDYGLYVRPYDMFMSEVDHAKYPDIHQKYRFALVEPDGTPIEEDNSIQEKLSNQKEAAVQKYSSAQIKSDNAMAAAGQVKVQIAEAQATEAQAAETKATEKDTEGKLTEAQAAETQVAEAKNTQSDYQNERKSEQIQPETEQNAEGQIDAGLLMFLDADNYQEKLNTLTLLRDKLDDNMINTMAASMDIEVADGPMDMRYNSLRNCILAHAKYECTRLR